MWYTAVRQRHQWVCDTVRRARAGRRATWCAGRGGVQRQWRNVACTCRAAVVYPRFTRSQERRGWGSSWVCRTARHSLWCAVCEEWEGVRTIGTGRERAAHAVGAVSAAPLLRCSACDCQEWPWPRSAHLSERRGTVIPPPLQSQARTAHALRGRNVDWQDNLYATPYWTQPTATRCERCAQSSSQQAAVLARGLDGGTLPHLLRPGGGGHQNALFGPERSIGTD